MNWIDVNDKLPEKGELVLCAYFDYLDYWQQLKSNCTGHLPEEKTAYIIRELINEDGQRWADEGITHWCRIIPPINNKF